MRFKGMNLFLLGVVVSLTIILPLSFATSGCGWLGTTARSVAANTAEPLVVSGAADLKKKYDIDVSADTPQSAIFKIVGTVAPKNPKLASLLTDASKVHTVGEALAVLATHEEFLTSMSEPEERAKVASDALESAKAVGKGLGLYAIVMSALSGWAFLKGIPREQAAKDIALKAADLAKQGVGFLVGKIEGAAAEGGAAIDVKAGVKNPDPHEAPVAAFVSKIVEEKYPRPSKDPIPSAVVGVPRAALATATDLPA